LRRLRKLWVAAGAAFVLLVIYLSVAPDPVRAPTVDNFKTGHILAYAWCMFWFGQAFRAARQRLAIGLALIVLGVALEFVQDMLPWHRDFAIADMIDDAIGVAIGLVLLVTPLGKLLARAERLTARSPAR
jgi:VanZ family protein